MKLHELKSCLRAHPGALPRFTLPNGERIPAHFHITEVGHVAKRFIDCGGTQHDKKDTCVLQTWASEDVDHRLDAATFAKILDLGKAVLPGDDIEVEVEWDCCVVSQYPIASVEVLADRMEFQLGSKHTDCLAKERCGIDDESCCAGATKTEAAGCC